TGWTGGTLASALSEKSEETIVENALESLHQVTGISRSRINHELDGWWYHDWQADPFARGAYSYIGVGGVGAQKKIAAPIEDTLFFAGEATHFGGQSGTVDGAIDTGVRAAEEVRRFLQGSRSAA